MRLAGLALALVLALPGLAAPAPDPARAAQKLFDFKAVADKGAAASQQICWKACFPERPSCPEGAYPKQFGECWTCCFGEENGVSSAQTVQEIHVKVETDNFAVAPAVPAAAGQGICLRICASEEIECPEGWTSKQFGECWTCCKGVDEGIAVTHDVPTPKPAPFAEQGVCLRLCAPVEIGCPEGWTSKQLGNCWTCCKGVDEGIVIPHAVPAPKPTPSAEQGICRAICIDEKPKCPEGWTPKQFGRKCWTCCKDEDEGIATPHAVPAHAAGELRHVKAKSAKGLAASSGSQGICLLICGAEPLECARGWSSVKLGDCYTCCKDSDSGLSAPAVAAGRPVQQTVHIEVDARTSVAPQSEICWLACFSEEIRCPEGWHSNQQKGCWTCCRSVGGLETQAVESPKQAVHVEVDTRTSVAPQSKVCWLACFSEKPDCPEGWNPKQQGDCWTCCRSIGDFEAQAVRSPDEKTGHLLGHHKVLVA